MTQQYQIELQGVLDQDWSSWLTRCELEHTSAGKTVLVGHVADQAMLHGLLARIRDLGVPILLVKRLDVADGLHPSI